MEVGHFFLYFCHMENNGEWTETFKIRTFMTDKSHEATMITIGNLFQDAAGNHANFRKLGYHDMKEQNMFWVLNRLKIQVIRFPKWLEEVNVSTWVSEMQPFSHRHFIMTDAQGQDIGCGYSLWTPIDTITHRIKRLTNFDTPILDKITLCGTPPKLPDTEGVELSSEKLANFSDLDFLGHVNNVKYIEWMLNDYYRNWGEDKFSSLEINYLNECLLDQVIAIYAKEEMDDMFYVLKRISDGKEICRARLGFC